MGGRKGFREDSRMERGEVGCTLGMVFYCCGGVWRNGCFFMSLGMFVG